MLAVFLLLGGSFRGAFRPSLGGPFLAPPLQPRHATSGQPFAFRSIRSSVPLLRSCLSACFALGSPSFRVAVGSVPVPAFSLLLFGIVPRGTFISYIYLIFYCFLFGSLVGFAYICILFHTKEKNICHD